MARLIVEAVRNEKLLMENQAGAVKLELLVSVSDATTGAGVSGLTETHFRITPPWDAMPAGWSLKWTAAELKYTPDAKPSGVYRLTLILTPPSGGPLIGFSFEGGVNYAFGVHVRRFAMPTSREGDLGQTVVSVMGYGQQVFVST